tara:strand:- start:594 stop:1604 length:1011 start_codon:yes stop_codon:yes gene_type:complete
MKNKSYLLIFAFIVSIGVVYLNSLRYESFRVQFKMYRDGIERNLSHRDMNFINSIKTEYPTVGLFGLPLSSQKGAYLIAKDSVFKGIEYLKKGQETNPYIMYPEGQLADIYLKLGSLDEFEYYTRRAFNNLPNNPLHFIHMVKLLKMQNKNDSIIYYFNKVEDILGPKDPQVYNIVLSALVIDEDTISKYGGKEIAKKALLIYPNEAKPIHDYIFYSKENMALASQKHEEGLDAYQKGNTELGIELLTQAIDLHPNNQQYFDNYIIANYNIKNYENILAIYSNYREKFIDVESDILYFLISSLYFTNDISTACPILREMDSKKVFAIDQSLFSYCF